VSRCDASLLVRGPFQRTWDPGSGVVEEHVNATEFDRLLCGGFDLRLTFSGRSVMFGAFASASSFGFSIVAITLNPRLANRSAVARPTPLELPVMRIVLVMTSVLS
jgi:hypothetical protein